MRTKLWILCCAFGLGVHLGCGQPPAPDGGVDGGVRDAGGVDAGDMLVDGGVDDGGSTVDAGRPVPDHPDAGALDAGVNDAGVIDAGGDAGAFDAGMSDDGCGFAGLDGTCADVVDCDAPLGPTSCAGGPAQQCCLDDAPTLCSVDGALGVCVDVADCPAGHHSTAGHCPGPAEIQCCTVDDDVCDETQLPLVNEPLLAVGEEIHDASCPAGMVRSADVCVDKYEASLWRIDGDGVPFASHSPYATPAGVDVMAVSLHGAVPQGYINQVQATAACANAGKRLCTDDEWLRACRGSTSTTYPYGDLRQPGVCHDAYDGHPAIEYFDSNEAWVFSEIDHPCLNQLPLSLSTTGAHPECVSEDGVVDMMGNLHEWTADPSGTFRGGFYVDTVVNGEGCLYRTTAHNTVHADYSTGFRCCADPL